MSGNSGTFHLERGNGWPKGVRLFVFLLGVLALVGCEGGALICVVEDQDDLERATDDACTDIRILAWPDEELVVEQDSTAPGRYITMLAANVKVMRTHNFDEVLFAGGLGLEELSATGLRRFTINLMQDLRKVQVEFAEVAEDEPPERLMGMVSSPALEEVTVTGEAGESFAVGLREVPWQQLNFTVSDGMQPGRSITVAEDTTLAALQELGSRAGLVELQQVPEDILLAYRDWLVGEGFAGELRWCAPGENSRAAPCERKLLPAP